MHGAEPWVLDLHGSISGSVFEDANHNGIRDPGEQGLPGVTVYLHHEDNANGSAGMTTTSDADGNYTFAGLLPGRYGIGQIVPAGDALTAPLGYSGIVTLLPAQSVPGPVFGDVPIATVPMDFDYLLTLAQHYSQQGTFATGDLNNDGQVNFDDLLLLAQNYGHSLSSAAAPASDVLLRPAATRPRRRALAASQCLRSG